MKLISIFSGHKIWFILIVIGLTGCDHNRTKNDEMSKIALNKALEFYGMIDDSDTWQLNRSVEQDYVLNFVESSDYSGGQYYFTKTIGDTNSWLAFELYYSAKDTILIPTEFYLRYENNFFQHVVLLGENSDTLFHYKASLYRDLHKTFITGKYYYQYLFNELNNRQRVFFRQNKDSLIQVRGNNLKPLPAN